MNKTILAFVGMPGAGKSEATAYLNQKGVPFVRFGQITEDAIKDAGLSITTENEKIFREKIREDSGMGAYAIKAKPKLDELLKKSDFIVIDGLYSWEEYSFLREHFDFLKLINVYAEPPVRYARLSKREIRPIDTADAYPRDIREIEKLNKGGPIAIADFIIVNNTDDLDNLYLEIDKILERLNINL